MEYYVGLDVSLRSVAVCVIDADGRAVVERSIAYEIEDIAQCLAGFEASVLRADGLTFASTFMMAASNPKAILGFGAPYVFPPRWYFAWIIADLINYSDCSCYSGDALLFCAWCVC